MSHGCDDQHTVFGLDGRQADGHRERGAVDTPPAQLETRSHGSGLRVGEIDGSVPGVDLSERLRQEHLDGLAEQAAPVVGEQRFGLSIDEPDRTCRVHPHHGVGRSLQQALELCLDLLAFGEVSGDLDEPAQAAVFVMHGSDDDVGPELGTVLANPPGLLLEAIVDPGQLELLIGGPGRALVVGVED